MKLSSSDREAIDLLKVHFEPRGVRFAHDSATDGTTTIAAVMGDMAGSSLTIAFGPRPHDVLLVALMSASNNGAGNEVRAQIRNVTDATTSPPYRITSTAANDECSLVVIWREQGLIGTKEYRIQWLVNAGTGRARQPWLYAVIDPL